MCGWASVKLRDTVFFSIQTRLPHFMNETWPLMEYFKGTTSIRQEMRQRRVNATETAFLSSSKSMETSANTTRERKTHRKNKNSGDLWRTRLCINAAVNIVITLSVSLSLSKRYIPEATTLVSYTRMWETLHDRPTTHRRPLHAYTRTYKHTKHTPQSGSLYAANWWT